MRIVPLSTHRTGLLLSIVTVIAGCEALQETGLPNLQASAQAEAEFQQAEEFRRQFRIHSDSEALRWLLAHCVEQGQTLSEVERILGTPGLRVSNPQWLRTQLGPYRRDDVAYRWGPDRDGKTIYLFFRDGRLINFDPRQYKDSPAEDLPPFVLEE